ncbi:MAG: tryptophan--tRNA ligase [Candidatus Omnitrophota bacterium]
MKQAEKRVLSGMRPTGPLHLGHVIGALENWKKIQGEHDCLFMVADWHALLSEYANPSMIKKNAIDNVIDWISFGIDPDTSVIFRQSDVPEHLELMIILSALTPLSWLERCPTYKEQLKELKGRELTTHGFLGYPVLQAADILLYKARAVPVGEDQLPHLELTREIARKFNSLYKNELFPDPKALLTAEPRLLGLDNRKMSKSYGNYIALSDTSDAVRKKVMSMITDPEKIRRNDPGDPEKRKCNVYAYHKIFSFEAADRKKKISAIESDCKNGTLGCVDCKKQLAEYIVRYLDETIQKKRSGLTAKKVEEILADGAVRAKKIACETMKEVKEVLGL